MDNILTYLTQGGDPAACGVYPRSEHATAQGARVFMAACGDADYLIAPASAGFSGEAFQAGGQAYCKAPLSHENAKQLRALFPFTAPSPVLGQARTFGVGDRLGIAGPGHIRVFEAYDAYPVFAQQSIRELSLTGRDFGQVLDCATFAVFREDFTRPWGADGDHLKTPAEIELALSNGYTMITLDCSEHIRNDVGAMTDAAVLAACPAGPALEKRYLGPARQIEGYSLQFDRVSLARMQLVYGGAIAFAADMYARYFAGRSHAPDFEISIDETATPTEPAQHYFVADQLLLRGVNIATLAPRFCGEFQKGVDYRGDLGQFEKEFAIHAAIARHFGYKLSVHSGSDKFSVFPIVGTYTQGRFHVKTAGTNWLEAMRVIALREPGLYREIHTFALETAFEEARKYYHVTTNLSKIPALDSLSDDRLPGLFEQDDARQLIHITYGLILGEKNPDGTYRFRGRLYAAWRAYSEEYAQRLAGHIGKHMELLYSGFESR